MHSLTNDRDAAATGEKPARSRDHLAVGHSLGDLLLRGVAELLNPRLKRRDSASLAAK